ncbi:MULTISPECIES: hypothetical protein [Acinetobacter]|uniref:hypothetical protein n=1 Tax=Acinetobacter TaxID=469 RepID=UPI00029C8941|nr:MULTISPECIES: hypothetical protein [Acinetobacter]EKU38708.1 hypothetical protein ACINWC141_1149 [Acinetobacter sp. WC-141]MDS7927493.1 hypothetical protein [Acinetobacter sp. V115_6]
MFSLEPQKKKPFWKEMDFYKEHWSIIVFIPALLGGIFQIFKLYSIDPSFVRFFAVEQVIPDGLFISFIISFSFLCYLVIYKYYNFDMKIKYGWSFKNIIYNIRNRFVVLLILGVCIIYIYLIEPIFKETTPFLFTIIQFVAELFSLYYFYEILSIITILYILRNFSDNNKPTKTERQIAIDNYFNNLNFNFFVLLILSLLTILVIFFILFKIFIIYSKINTLPQTKNEEIFLNKIQSTFQISHDLKIEYYNGKYIFIKITEKNHKEDFLILKGESFVNLIDKDEK